MWSIKKRYNTIPILCDFFTAFFNEFWIFTTVLTNQVILTEKIITNNLFVTNKSQQQQQDQLENFGLIFNFSWKHAVSSSFIVLELMQIYLVNFTKSHEKPQVLWICIIFTKCVGGKGVHLDFCTFNSNIKCWN